MCIVLLVGDESDELAPLRDDLYKAGYRVLVATNCEAAVQQIEQYEPAIILLDSVVAGATGLGVCRELKTNQATQPIPIILMCALADTDSLCALFEAGGTDYVTKPVQTHELIARMDMHLKTARVVAHACHALDACGQATVAISLHKRRLLWQTPLASSLLQEYFEQVDARLPGQIQRWLSQASAAQQAGKAGLPLNIARGVKRLTLTLLYASGEDEWLVLLREESRLGLIEALKQVFQLTPRESEVLYWVSQGKTNRQIGAILGASPRTVNKHLEHVFSKLGVETRTAATNLAINKVTLGSPAFGFAASRINMQPLWSAQAC